MGQDYHVTNRPDYTTMITSGVFRSSDGAITGVATLDFINQFKVDYSIIGIASIETDGSLLDFDYKEVSVSQAMIENSRKRYLIGNTSLFDRNALIRLGHISDFDMFFTNKTPSNLLRRKLDDANIQYFIADET
ncbi:MAG: hypothetical protein N4Q30_04245 [Neisseriaceae bacterium]|nr:hypothetical protein [Neisseriaceae bacterium]